MLIDIAARLDGYFADITQQVFLGIPSAEYTEIYEVVRRRRRTAFAQHVPA